MNTLYVVEAESGVSYGNCELGVGLSRAAAIRDAYGPGGKLPHHAWVRIVRKDEEPARFERMLALNGLCEVSGR
jgi:hypothetical protein